VVFAVIERMTKLLHYKFTGNETPSDLVKLGLCDPCKEFVKFEPHKLSKILEGRYRLITSMSLIDNIICRLLCSLQNETEINEWKDIPSKPGLGLNDEGLRAIKMSVLLMSKLGRIAEGDVKGWDWSVQEWDFINDFHRRVYLCSGYGTVFEHLLYAHFRCMARKVFVLSDGTMYQQLLPGIMPSGWYNTSSSNSAIRGKNHYIIADQRKFDPCVIAMGDDSLERWFPKAVEAYFELGKNMGMFNEVEPTDFEFCSTRFTGPLGYPVNVDKQLFNILSKPPENQVDGSTRYSQFAYEMRWHHERTGLLEIVNKSGWWGSVRDESGVVM